MALYALVRSSRRRTLCLQITPAGELRVLAPAAASRPDIDAFVQAHASWIHRTRARLDRARPPDLWSRRILPYLDEQLPLVLELGGTGRHAQRRGAVLTVQAPDETAGRQVVEHWYRAQARRHSIARILHFAPQVGRSPTALRVAGQKTRWGSCSARGLISLNWRLMLAPAGLFDYVIVHELCHLLAAHHQPSFWHEVRRVMPDYESRRQQLRDQGHRFVF
ncbi:MAG: M48 family metallopeptidase [Acidiferrobacter sp.]